MTASNLNLKRIGTVIALGVVVGSLVAGKFAGYLGLHWSLSGLLGALLGGSLAWVCYDVKSIAWAAQRAWSEIQGRRLFRKEHANRGRRRRWRLKLLEFIPLAGVFVLLFWGLLGSWFTCLVALKVYLTGQPAAETALPLIGLLLFFTAIAVAAVFLVVVNNKPTAARVREIRWVLGEFWKITLDWNPISFSLYQLPFLIVPWLAKFGKRVFLYLHEEPRTLVFSWAAIGAAIGASFSAAPWAIALGLAVGVGGGLLDCTFLRPKLVQGGKLVPVQKD